MSVMVQHAPEGTTDVPASLRAVLHKLKRRGLVVIVSDLIDQPEETLKAIRLIRSHRHDVLVFHVQDAAESEFTFQGATLFRDLETGEELEIDPAAVRDHYLDKLRELNEFFRKGMTEAGVAYQRVDTRQPYDALLSAYLARRARTRR